MAQPPLDTSLSVRKLFTAHEIERVRRYVEGFRRVRWVLPAPASPPPIRWPEWVTALATAGVFVTAIIPAGLLAEHPTVRLGLIIATIVPFNFWVLVRLSTWVRLWLYRRRRKLDEQDGLLARAAALVRAAELVRAVVSPPGARASLGYLESFIHGPSDQRVREALREGYAGAQAVADMILCLRPPLHSETLSTWGRTLRDRVVQLHRAVVEIGVMTRTLPEERRHLDEPLRNADAAYDNYREFWVQFSEGSGPGVLWDYVDPLLPDPNLALPQVRYSILPAVNC